MKKKTLVEKMMEMINILPEKDIIIATNLIKKRDFESLLEIVSSDIKILERKSNSESIDDFDMLNEERLNNMCKLKADIESYLLLLGYDIDDVYGINECESNIEYTEMDNFYDGENV